jgi:hypothetical protein
MSSLEDAVMERYSFTLRVEGIDTSTERYEDALFEAGCKDALIAIMGRTVYLDFDREAPSFEEAVASAKMNVEKAGGKVIAISARR